MRLHEIKAVELGFDKSVAVLKAAWRMLKHAEDAPTASAMLDQVKSVLQLVQETYAALKTDYTIAKAMRETVTPPPGRRANDPAKSFDQADMRSFNKYVQPDFTNTWIDVPPYNKTDFRVMIIKGIIEKLTRLVGRLETAAAIEKAAIK